MTTRDMTAAIDLAAAAETLRVLSNPLRLRIAILLLGGERAVGDLETTLSARQPALSQHLAAMRDATLVVTRRESKSIFYRLADDDRRRLVKALVFGFGGAAPMAEERPTKRAQSSIMGASFAIVGGSA
jgi:DNA-binding transcriptional ArsR family regulator